MSTPMPRGTGRTSDSRRRVAGRTKGRPTVRPVSVAGRLGEFALSGSGHPHSAGHASNINRSLCVRSGRSCRGPSSCRSRQRKPSGPRARRSECVYGDVRPSYASRGRIGLNTCRAWPTTSSSSGKYQPSRTGETPAQHRRALGSGDAAVGSHWLARCLSCNHSRFIYAGSHFMQRDCWAPVLDADAPDLQALGDGYPTHKRRIGDA